ncbi:hypothetical protein ILYODFUR_028403 [Ilyodon furcidens]|uniref:Uncharacterized protein n=1 Tax=Ilyodon furcidens TaxID=33524 RepID=A0ABV0V6U3_9TELE
MLMFTFTDGNTMDFIHLDRLGMSISCSLDLSIQAGYQSSSLSLHQRIHSDLGVWMRCDRQVLPQSCGSSGAINFTKSLLQICKPKELLSSAPDFIFPETLSVLQLIFASHQREPAITNKQSYLSTSASVTLLTFSRRIHLNLQCTD